MVERNTKNRICSFRALPSSTKNLVYCSSKFSAHWAFQRQTLLHCLCILPTNTPMPCVRFKRENVTLLYYMNHRTYKQSYRLFLKCSCNTQPESNESVYINVSCIVCPYLDNTPYNTQNKTEPLSLPQGRKAYSAIFSMHTTHNPSSSSRSVSPAICATSSAGCVCLCVCVGGEEVTERERERKREGEISF